MTDLWDDLLSCLDLTGDTSAEGAARVGGGGVEFEGKNLRLEYHRLFGGQLLAQSARAAALTCPGQCGQVAARAVPREGTADEPVRYEVSRHQEGQTFGTLTIMAWQSRGVIGTASVSMHALEDGRCLQTTGPVREAPSDSAPVDIGLLPFETRSRVNLDAREVAPPDFSLWLRTPSAAPESRRHSRRTPPT